MVELLTAFYQLAGLQFIQLLWRGFAIVNSKITHNVRDVAQTQRYNDFVLLDKQGELDMYIMDVEYVVFEFTWPLFCQACPCTVEYVVVN